MLTHPMLDQLAQLGLSGMAQAFAELEASGEGATLTHADWLGLLVDPEINGRSAVERAASRQERTVPLVAELATWMRAERARLSHHAGTAKAIDYILKRWPAFTRFLDDGRICLSNNAAERALRGIALGRRAWLFAGSDRGGERAAAMYTLIATATLNNINPQAWLADVLARIADHPASRLHELLPWHWKTLNDQAAAA